MKFTIKGTLMQIWKSPYAVGELSLLPNFKNENGVGVGAWQDLNF